MIESKSLLMSAALAALLLVSVPGVIFNDAIRRYFSFMGGWNTATIKPSRPVSMPPHRYRNEALVPVPGPELRFVKFSLKLPKAKKVAIAGEFNRWDTEALGLVKRPDGRWEAMLPLPPGRYKYICRVDGKDILDPLNPETDTENGRKVSVLVVK